MLRVLLIEGGHWDAQALIDHLRDHDALAIHVSTVEEAIARVKSDPDFDGILSDVAKEGIDGLDFVNWLNENWPDHPPILFHSTAKILNGIDLELLNLHASERISFAPKAYIMAGASEDDYAYLKNFVSSMRARCRDGSAPKG